MKKYIKKIAEKDLTFTHFIYSFSCIIRFFFKCRDKWSVN